MCEHTLDTQIIIKHFHIFFSSKMSGKNKIFDDKKINKSNCSKNKNVFNIYDIDVNKILISKNKAYGKKSSFKHFGYNDNDDDDVIRPLCIKLPQMTGYVKHFDSNKTMSFNDNDNRLLKKYAKIWEKGNILMNIEFDNESVYSDNDKYIKAKIKSYGDKVKQISVAKNTKRKCII